MKKVDDLEKGKFYQCILSGVTVYVGIITGSPKYALGIYFWEGEYKESRYYDNMLQEIPEVIKKA